MINLYAFPASDLLDPVKLKEHQDRINRFEQAVLRAGFMPSQTLAFDEGVACCVVQIVQVGRDGMVKPVSEDAFKSQQEWEDKKRADQTPGGPRPLV